MLNRIDKNVTKYVLGNGFPCSCGCFGQLRDGSVDCRQKHPVGLSSGPGASSQLLSVGFGGPAPVWGVGRAVGWGYGLPRSNFSHPASPRWFVPLASRLPVVKHHFGERAAPVAITVESEFFTDVVFG